MHKRVLLIEESDTIRGVAESLLRQNGFEVLSMKSGEKALEVLNLTKPDVIVVASDMKYKGNTLMYKQLQINPNAAELNILVMADENELEIAHPTEKTINKPFDPKEFIGMVSDLSGALVKTDQITKDPSNPLSVSQVEDEFLDAALGLDGFEVTDSEVMGNKTTKIQTRKKSGEKMIGYEHLDDTTGISTESGKVESLMIRDEDADISQENEKKKKQEEKSGGGLDILDDQFGLVDLNSTESQHPADFGDHDYNWFLNELQNDAMKGDGKDDNSGKEDLSQSQKLAFEDNASIVDPVPRKTQSSENAESKKSAGVDDFINEFKKEVEKFNIEETESITINESTPKEKPTSSLNWQDSIESISQEQIDLFKKEFIDDLSEKISIKIADKIDSVKLLALLKQEIIERAKKS